MFGDSHRIFAAWIALRISPGGAELDLLVVRGATRRGFEFKRTSTPKLTPSMRSAMESLKLDSLDVVHAGDATWPLAPCVRAVALGRVLEDVAVN